MSALWKGGKHLPHLDARLWYTVNLDPQWWFLRRWWSSSLRTSGCWCTGRMHHFSSSPNSYMVMEDWRLFCSSRYENDLQDIPIRTYLSGGQIFHVWTDFFRDFPDSSGRLKIHWILGWGGGEEDMDKVVILFFLIC